MPSFHLLDMPPDVIDITYFGKIIRPKPHFSAKAYINQSWNITMKTLLLIESNIIFSRKGCMGGKKNV